MLSRDIDRGPTSTAEVKITQYRSLEADLDFQQELNEAGLQNLNLSNSQSNRNSNKRKRAKLCSPGKTYDFREHGVDARRRGAKHQRRKQNLADLLDTIPNEHETNFDDDWYSGDHLTLFTELFLDETKMKAWEHFVNMPEDWQKEYLEERTGGKRKMIETNEKENGSSGFEEESKGFQMIDKKIQDMLSTKKLAALGLLEYYEDDMRSCTLEGFPSILVLNLDSSYDRLLVYAICQYMKLSSNNAITRSLATVNPDYQIKSKQLECILNILKGHDTLAILPTSYGKTIRLKDNNAVIMIDLPSFTGTWKLPETKLTEYLKRMRKHS